MLIELASLLRRQRFTINGCIHVGAHLGEEAEAYAKAKAGPVWWVEGNGDLIGILNENVKTWNAWGEQSVIHALAGSSEREAATLHVANNGQSSSVLPLGTHAVVHPEVHYVGDVQAPMRTVDSLVAEHGIRATLLNADTQGYEMEVLKGAERFLSEQAEVLILEVNEDDLYRGCARRREIEDWLLPRGFRMRELCMMRQGWGDAVFMRGTEGVR